MSRPRKAPSSSSARSTPSPAARKTRAELVAELKAARAQLRAEHQLLARIFLRGVIAIVEAAIAAPPSDPEASTAGGNPLRIPLDIEGPK